MEAKERGGEKSMNGAADIIFLPCIIRNRGCRCRRVKISYVPGILVYIYIYISDEYRNLSVSSVVRRRRRRRRPPLQSGDFNFPAIDRAKKGKEHRSRIPPPLSLPLAPNLSRTRNFSFSFLDHAPHTRYSLSRVCHFLFR